ncbi:hypothetical protein GCM10022221_63410 [Actinocorallia aurea]
MAQVAHRRDDADDDQRHQQHRSQRRSEENPGNADITASVTSSAWAQVFRHTSILNTLAPCPQAISQPQPLESII